MLEKLDVILAKASEDEIKSDILPMIFSTLESNSIQGQVLVVANYCTVPFDTKKLFYRLKCSVFYFSFIF